MAKMKILLLFFVINLPLSIAFCQNQTETVSTPLDGSTLPFNLKVKTSTLTLPEGLQSFVLGTYNGEWLILSGRTNGLHGFDPTEPSFPITKQNKIVYVINPKTKAIYSRSLEEINSGFTSHQVDLLSATSTLFLQEQNLLYLVGGYGFDSRLQDYTTHSALTIINIEKMIKWVKKGGNGAKSISQFFDKRFQITGGELKRSSPHDPFLIMVGQNFEGVYAAHSGKTIYSYEIRRFELVSTKNGVYPVFKEPIKGNSCFRRRDLNITPYMNKKGGQYLIEHVILSGVFTETEGVWTTPIVVKGNGDAICQDPLNPLVLRQGMNNYACPYFTLYSEQSKENYIVLAGGLSYLTWNGSSFVEDFMIPFSNGISTIKRTKQGFFSQYIMPSSYPIIPSDFANNGNPLLFGTNALFVAEDSIKKYSGEILDFDSIKKGSCQIGYILGGIVSSLPNTDSNDDSKASSYIFDVYLEKK